jgi:hypothetical protein
LAAAALYTEHVVRSRMNSSSREIPKQSTETAEERVARMCAKGAASRAAHAEGELSRIRKELGID